MGRIDTMLERLDKRLVELEKGAGALPELPPFEPHKAQKEIIDNAARFNVVTLGRRAGKTTLGIRLLGDTALQGLPTAWLAPVYRSITEVWREFTYYLDPVIRSMNTQERRIELYTGGVIEFWSLDLNPKRLRGRKYARVIIDEAASVVGLRDSWHLIVRPTLTDYIGDCFMFSTPMGFNDYYLFHSMGESDDYPEWRSWRMSSYSNPYLDPNELDAIRASTPAKAFAQEYLAEFLETLSAGMFDRSWFTVEERLPQSYRKKVRAWDLAATVSDSADFTVGVLMGLDRDGFYYVLDVVRGKWSVAQRDKMILETARRDGTDTVILLEEEGGSSGKAQSSALARMLAGYVVKTIRPTGDKVTRAAPFASQAELGNVYVARGAWLREYLNELESFPDPNALHDDQVDASSYAFNELAEPDRAPMAFGIVIGGSQKG